MYDDRLCCFFYKFSFWSKFFFFFILTQSFWFIILTLFFPFRNIYILKPWGNCLAFYTYLCIHSEVVLFLFQVLLSQCHRFRALVLLGRFLDMGPWAVDLVISITIRQIFVQFLSIFSKTVVLYDNWIRVSCM